MKTGNTLLEGIGTTIFTVMSALATTHGAINLGQGFPDTDGPEDVIAAAAAALRDGAATNMPRWRACRSCVPPWLPPIAASTGWISTRRVKSS